jgi:hypothetical protein
MPVRRRTVFPRFAADPRDEYLPTRQRNRRIYIVVHGGPIHGGIKLYLGSNGL